MARISSYGFDNNVTDSDAWIGTDASNRITKQFSAEAVAKYLNIKGKISISAQMVFKYKNTIESGAFAGPADGSSIAAITTMDISNADASGQNTVEFMEYLVGNDILISEQNDISKFGHFNITSYTAKGNNHTLVIANVGGNGTLKLDKFYDFAVFTLSSPDKTFEFTQGQPATTWNIQHDLNKFPSVSVINNNNVVINGEVTYIDKNNVQINFSAGFSGKAYLN
jgi:hypothetical protein